MNQNEAVDDDECLFFNTLFLFMYTSRCLVGYPFFLEGLVPTGGLELGASSTHMKSCKHCFLIVCS